MYLPNPIFGGFSMRYLLLVVALLSCSTVFGAPFGSASKGFQSKAKSEPFGKSGTMMDRNQKITGYVTKTPYGYRFDDKSFNSNKTETWTKTPMGYNVQKGGKYSGSIRTRK